MSYEICYFHKNQDEYLRKIEVLTLELRHILINNLFHIK